MRSFCINKVVEKVATTQVHCETHEIEVLNIDSLARFLLVVVRILFGCYPQ